MSYCRKNDKSDVHMYPIESGWIVCHECLFAQKMRGREFHEIWLRGAKRALAHLQRHIRENHKVPQSAIDMLIGEIEG